MSHPVLAYPRRTNGYNYKPQAYSASGTGGARSGGWAPTLGYFISGGGGVSEDPIGWVVE